MVPVALEKGTTPLTASTVAASARRFAAYAVAAYLALLALVALDLWRVHRDAIADAERNTAELSSILTEQSLRALKTLNALIPTDPDAVRASDRPTQHLADTVGVRAVVHADVQGNATSEPGFAGLPADIADLDFFKAQKNGDAGLYVGHPLRDAGPENWVVPMSRRLAAPGGQFAGIGAVLVDLDYLRSFYQTAELGPSGVITMVLADGTVLLRQPSVTQIVGSSLAGRRLFREELAKAPSGNFRERSQIDGIERVLSFARIPGTPLIVVVGTAIGPALAPLYREMRTDFAAALLIGALLLLSAWLLSRRQVAGEAMLRAGEARVRRMTDNLPGAIFSRVQHADGRVDYPYMSPGAEKILGYSPSELAADPALLYVAVHPDDRERLQSSLRHSLESLEPWSIELRVVGRDGAVKWVHALSHPRRGRDGEVIWDGFLLDVTNRKHAEAALEAIRLELQRKNHVLDIAFDNMSQGIAVHDAAHRLLAFNRRFEELFKLPRGFARPGLTYQEIFECSVALGNYAPEDGPRLWAERRRVLDGGQRQVLRQQMNDGRVIEAVFQPLADGGSVITFTDVSEAVRREAELAAKSQFLQVTLEHMGDGISVFDSERRLRAWNDRYFELLDLPPEFARVGTRWGDIGRYLAARGEFGAGDPREIMARRRQEIDLMPQQHWERRRPNGTVIDFQRNQMPDGGYVTVYRDITALKQTQEALVAAKDEAEQANRSKGEFLANMSHELRTPLNAIIGFSDILRQQMFGPLGSARYLDYSSDIHASGTHLLDLINDVLDMSKIEAGRFELDEERIDLLPLFQACLGMVQTRSLASNISLVLDLAPTLPAVWADARALKQITLNLLSNGVKFTPAGGQVTLAARRVAEGLAIIVSDSGIGIAAEAVARVVHPFGQADASISRRFGGTGLGLSISKRLAELHGGSLIIESAVGSGTTVTVLLPAHRILAGSLRLEATQQ